MEALRQAHDREDCGLKAKVEEAEEARKLLTAALAKSEAEAASASKESGRTEKLLAEFRQEHPWPSVLVNAPVQPGREWRERAGNRGSG